MQPGAEYRDGQPEPPPAPAPRPLLARMAPLVFLGGMALGGAAFLIAAKAGIVPVAVQQPEGTNGGTHVARLSDYPPPGQEEEDSPLGRPPFAPRSKAYTFSVVQDFNPEVPVAYSPCRPIHWVLNAAQEPEGTRRLLHSAFSELSRATGLQFVYDGITGEPPERPRDPFQPDLYGDVWAPVLVAWTDAETVPNLAEDVVGVAGSTWITRPDGTRAYITGQVLFDAPETERLRDIGGDALVRAVMLHELGHLVGLGHVADPEQIMWEEADAAVTSYQDGDLAGLARLGAGACGRDY